MTNDETLMEMLLKILDGDYKKALDLVNNEIHKNETGWYLNSDGTSIYDMVKKYCVNMLENKKSVNGESMAAYDDTRNGNAIINKVLPRKRSLNGLRLEAIIKNK